MVVKQKAKIAEQDHYVKDMEDYIDRLLVKVIETSPKLLQNPSEKMQPQMVVTNSSPLNNRTVEMTRNNTAIIHPNLTTSLKITNPMPKIMNMDSNSVTANNRKPVKTPPVKNPSKKSGNPFKKIQAALK